MESQSKNLKCVFRLIKVYSVWAANERYQQETTRVFVYTHTHMYIYTCIYILHI